MYKDLNYLQNFILLFVFIELNISEYEIQLVRSNLIEAKKTTKHENDYLSRPKKFFCVRSLVYELVIFSFSNDEETGREEKLDNQIPQGCKYFLRFIQFVNIMKKNQNKKIIEKQVIRFDRESVLFQITVDEDEVLISQEIAVVISNVNFRRNDRILVKSNSRL